ncbi:hypothetical protein GCM10010398_73210 [Streptomyces fimbriatus]
MVAVVALVAVELVGPAPPSAAPEPDWKYALHERDRGLAVVDVRPGNGGGQERTGPLGDQVDLRAVLAPVIDLLGDQRIADLALGVQTADPDAALLGNHAVGAAVLAERVG